jgi:hypothetical protein
MSQSCKRNLYRAIEALQNARDHLVIALADPVTKNRRIDCAAQDIRDAMEELGILDVKEKEPNGY